MTRQLPLTIVVAVAANGVIGRDNALPWRLRTDLRRFKALTIGHPMIMGRRSWDAVGRPLPGRESVVLTRDRDFRPEGAHVAHDWAGAKALATRLAGGMGAGAVIVFGGAEIYRIALPETERIHLTEVHARPDGDTLFPHFDRACFRETWREDHSASEQDEHPFSFVDLWRQPASAQA